MRLLGENVAALRVANGWTLAQLADNVRRCGAPNVKHQNLQQLEAKPNTRPRYLIELACAFGKTVEDLRSWEPSMPAYGPNNRASHAVHEVREDGPSYWPSVTREEQHLLDDYRRCDGDVQKAIKTMVRAARSS